MTDGRYSVKLIAYKLNDVHTTKANTTLTGTTNNKYFKILGEKEEALKSQNEHISQENERRIKHEILHLGKINHYKFGKNL